MWESCDVGEAGLQELFARAGVGIVGEHHAGPSDRPRPRIWLRRYEHG
jgi:hypothetical protein